VFNKSNSGDIETALHIRGAAVKSARRWTVTGPSLESTNVHGIPVSETDTALDTPIGEGGTIQHVFPAHSMTAFEIVKR
jgi:hypothetical protein